MSEHGIFKGRALDLLRLDPPVRRIVFTTGVTLLFVALACAVREDFPGPAARLPDGFIIPLAVIFIAAVTATLGLSLLVAGAAHARTRWRYALLAPLALCVAAALTAALDTLSNDWSDWAGWLFIAACWLGPMLFVAVAAIAAPRYRAVPVFWTVFALSAACTVVVAVASIVVEPAFGESFILYLVGLGAVALEPALLVVGFDIADIGADFAALGAGFLEKQNTIVQRIARAALIVVAFAAAWLVYGFTGFTGLETIVAAGWFVGITAAVALAAFLTMRRTIPPASGASPQYHYLLLVAAAFTLIALTISFSSEPLPGLFSASGLRSYSFALPTGLSEFGERFPSVGHMTDVRSPTRVMFGGENGWPLVAVIGTPRPPFIHPEDHFTSVNGMIRRKDLQIMPIPAAALGPGGWGRSVAATKDKSGRAFRFEILRRDVPTTDVATDMNWFIVCGDMAANFAATKARCETVARSFQASARKRTSRALAVVFDLLLFAAAFSALALAQWRGRTRDSAGLDFVFWALFLNGLRGILGYAGAGWDYAFYDTFISALLVCTLLGVTGAFALALEFCPASRGFDIAAARRIAGRAAASMLVLCALFVLYVFAIKGSDESQIIRGVIICFALLWELVMSGERLNLSAEHHLFPRSSRVFLLVGYLMLVATVVFLMTGLLADGGKTIVPWNSELFVANGIAVLGGALILNRAVRAFARLRVAGASHEETKAAAHDPQ